MSQERVSGFPEKGADLRGSLGNFPGSLGNFRGSLRNFRGSSGLLLSSTVRELPGKAPKNFRGSPGNFRGSLGTSQKLGGARLPPSDSPNLSPRDVPRFGSGRPGIWGSRLGSQKNFMQETLGWILVPYYFKILWRGAGHHCAHNIYRLDIPFSKLISTKPDRKAILFLRNSFWGNKTNSNFKIIPFGDSQIFCAAVLTGKRFMEKLYLRS